MSLQRGISRLCLESNRNTNVEMLCKLNHEVEYLIVPKGTKFIGSGKSGLSEILVEPRDN